MNRYFILIITILLPFAALSQQYKAVSISLTDGLSQSSVYEIIQDKAGFTWMATQDGLNRYDGNQFYVYRDEPFDTNSISSNYINDLLCDSGGRIWVGTANHGLNLLLPGSETFRRFKAGNKPGMLSSNIITDLFQDSNGVIWVGTGNGLHRMKETGTGKNLQFSFERIPLVTAVNDTVSDKYVNSIVCDNSQQLWVATYSGLFKIDISKPGISNQDVTWYGKANNHISDYVVFSLAVDNSGKIWAGGKNGIDIFSSAGERVMILNTVASSQTGMVSNQVNTLYKTSSGDIWVGFFDKGVQLVKAGAHAPVVVFERPELVSPVQVLSKGNAISFWEDRITKGIIWTGFNAGGAVRMVPVMKKFITNDLSDSPLSSSFVINILKDPENNTWIGTPEGLMRYNGVDKSYETYVPSVIRKKPLSGNYINGLVFTRKGDVLFGSGNDIFVIETSGGKSKVSVQAIPSSNKKEGNNLRTIVTDRAGNIYLVLRYAVINYDPEKNIFTPVLNISDEEKLSDIGFFISSCFIDHAGNYWVGTSSGLEYYPAHSGSRPPDFNRPVTFLHHPADTSSLRNHNILCIAEDNSNNIWLGTMNGLTRVKDEKGAKRFLNYSTKNGLKNNVIYAIIPDNKTGHLWLSTNNGLIEFNPDGSVVANYDAHDGLQSNEFNSYAACKTAGGEMLFGGIAGYTSFYPDQILRDPTLPLISISNIIFNNNRMVNLSGTEEAKTIDLKYKDNSFTVNFTGLHYVDPKKIQYAYMLEGFQSDWTYAGNSNRVNFSQLPPGRYVFKVKASNSDGIYNEAGDMFVINIDPPFHKTIWFYLVIAGVVAGIIYGLFRYRLQMKMEQVKEVEQLRRATAADFHDELGHKLTIISWFAEILKKKIGPEQQELRPHLDRIIEASGNLYHTMKDMLWAMDPDKDSVFDLYNQIKEFGLELYDNTGIEFEASDIPDALKENIISPAHKRHVLLIFKEIMHNSLKHAGGTATALDFDSGKEFIRFRFRDNGKGFKMNGQSVGRGLENVKRRARQIHASISIQSEGTGTVAVLDIPLNELN